MAGEKRVAGARKNRAQAVRVSAAVLALLALQFLYQAWAGTPAPLAAARALAFSGATLIALALLAGPLAVAAGFPGLLAHRRALGVAGFALALLHVPAAVAAVYAWDLGAAYWSLNPLENPVVWGSLALALFLPLFLSSTDRAVQGMGFKRWKRLHRLAYPAFAFLVAHFAKTNPLALQSLPGYLLVALAAAVYALEAAAFWRVRARRGWRAREAWHGYAMALVVAGALYAGLVL